jgi:hypothetical protein
MKFLAFSFKKEAMWIIILTLAVPAVGILGLLVVYLLRLVK